MATTVTVDKTRKTLVMAGWYRMDMAMGLSHCFLLDPAACLYLTADSELLVIVGCSEYHSNPRGGVEVLHPVTLQVTITS
jgi:hypothetical protein